jgi:hypothetical protein
MMMPRQDTTQTVIPAKAGIRWLFQIEHGAKWMTGIRRCGASGASAGMTASCGEKGGIENGTVAA